MKLEEYLEKVDESTEHALRYIKVTNLAYVLPDTYAVLRKDKSSLVELGNEIPSEDVSADGNVVALETVYGITVMSINEFNKMFLVYVLERINEKYFDHESEYNRIVGLEKHVTPNKLAQSLIRRCRHLPVCAYQYTQCPDMDYSSVVKKHYVGRMSQCNPVYKAALMVLIMDEIKSVFFLYTGNNIDE